MFNFKKIGDPVALRYDEARTRPQALESLGQEIQLCQKLLDLFNQKVIRIWIYLKVQ